VVLKITDMASPASQNMFVFATVNFTISEYVEVVANDDALTVLANSGPVSFNVVDNDRCPRGCEVLTTSLPTGVEQISTTGAFTFTSGETLGAQTFTYTLRSTASPSVIDTASVALFVEGALPDSASTAPGEVVSIAVLANDPCGSCAVDSATGVLVGIAHVVNNEILYTPPEWFAGATSFTYVVRASNGSTSSALVTVNVIKAANDSFTVSSGVSTTLDPLANDLCVDCRITSASGGDIVDDGFGLVVAASSATSLTYVITDASGATSSATITLTVAEPPVATNDQVNTSAGTAVTVDVLANDKQTSSATDCAIGCSAEVLSDPANGSVSLRADGTLQYTPRGAFAGVDSFTYLVLNEFGLSDSGTVTVQVNPVAFEDLFTVGTGLNDVILPVTDNDLCGDCTLTVDSSSGLNSVTVDNGNLRISSPAVPGTATILYTVTTATGGLTASTTVRITVSDASPDAVTTSASTPVTLNVIANDALNTTAVSAVSDPGMGIGTTSFDGATVTFNPASNFGGLAEFTYTTGAGTSATVSVLVAPTTVSVTTRAGVSASGISLQPASCSDCEVTVVVGSDAGDLELSEDGTFTFAPAESFTGTDDALRYEIHHVPTGLRVTGAVEVTVDAPVAALVAGLELSMSIAANTPTVGETATVTYTMTNSGTATLSAVTLVDPLVTSAFTCNPAGYPIAELAPDAVVTCTATFSITQAQIDAGGVTSVASVSATSAVTGVDDPTTVGATSTLALVGTASLEFSKTAVVDITAAAPVDQLGVGDRIDFTFTVTNSGTTTVSDIRVSDPLLGLVGMPCPDLVALAPGASQVCTGQHTITQADLDVGGVTNSATVSALAQSGIPNPQVTDTVFVALVATPSVTISATGPASATVSAVGETLPITYTVTNNGPVALQGLSVLVSGGTITCFGSGTNSIAALTVGASQTCTAVHTIVQNDLNASQFTHSATVSGATLAGAQASASASVIVPLTIEPEPEPTPVTPVAPVARINSDRVSAPMGAVVSLRPLANDEGQNLRITSITAPNVGFAQLVGDTVTFTPPLFHVGPISLSYTASDGQNSGSAQITLTMTDTGALLLPEMFLDMNRNGRRDVGEPGIPQVQMSLTQTARAQLVVESDGSLRLASMRTAAVGSSFSLFASATGGCTTDSSGLCLPPSLPAGSYMLTIAFDPEIHGMDMTSAPGGAVGMTTGIVLSGLDEVRPAFGFGFAGPGTIAAAVAPEQWVEVVWAGSDDEFGTDDDLVILVRGDSNGELLVPGLPKGRYLIRPAGSGLTSTNGVSNGDVVMLEVSGTALVRIDLESENHSGRLPTVGSEIEAVSRLAVLLVSLGTLLALVEIGSRRRRVKVL
jgi:hypothetical protein